MLKCFVKLKRNATKCAKNLKNSFSKIGAFSSEQNFIRGDPDRLSDGLTVKPKLLKRFSVTEEICVPSLVLVGPCRSLKRSAANMPRLWFSQNFRSHPTILETLRPSPLH
jgi:hypothetical protein